MPAMDSSNALPQPGRVCATCCFWRLDKAADPGAGWGQCRRQPPATPPIHDDKLVHVGIWPHTQQNDWCGEWQAGG